MPPKRQPVTTQRPATRSQSSRIPENKTVATSGKSSRVRAVRSLDPSTLHPPSKRTTRSSNHIQAQKAPSPATLAVKVVSPKPGLLGTTSRESATRPSPPARSKRKREPEEGDTSKPGKQLQPEDEPTQAPPPLHSASEKLAEEVRLEILNGMGSEKRSLSRRGSNVDVTNDAISTTSQKTSISLLNYRLLVLEQSRIVVQHRGLPEHIQSLVDAILQPEISEERKCALNAIADKLCNAFPDILEVASREDDFVELIERALEAIDELVGRVFTRRRKADFEPSMKPRVQRTSWLNDSPEKLVDDLTDPQSQRFKRQQVEPPYISPKTSQGDMPPPPSKPDTPLVKTPRPDITNGFLDSVITVKLRKLGVDELSAKEMLKDLQIQRVLLSSPTLPAHVARFPPMIVEGKGYGTGKSMYEAENQAAVSGSCMLLVQRQLAELTEQRSPGSHQRKEPLAFSICHEGPDINLWVHYYTWVCGVPYYNMHLLAQCHATLRSTVRAYFIALLGVMQWASTELLDDIVAQLFLVWKARQRHTV